MCRIVQYGDKYKDELFKFGNSGIILIKDKTFILSTEFKIFTQGNKKIKSDYFVFLDINKNNLINGVIAINKEGNICYLSTLDKEFRNVGPLINKGEEELSEYNILYIEGMVNAKNILLFNDLGFKSVRYVSSEPEYNFLVRRKVDQK